jgi:hypothetical protein
MQRLVECAVLQLQHPVRSMLPPDDQLVAVHWYLGQGTKDQDIKRAAKDRKAHQRSERSLP